MPTCPVCDSAIADGSQSCEHCSCALNANNETVVSNGPGKAQQTVVASDAFTRPSSAGAAPARALSAELPMGHVLVGRYEILHRLGQGGMGTVYQALDRELEKTVALKTIRPDLASNASALRRLKQETLLARQIAHRNVIRVFDLGVAEGLRFITMEFVDGHDLRSELDAKGKLPADEAIEILTQICQGLAAAHAEDVIHRDLKPQNVLLSPGGRVRLVDFGLARSFEDTGLTHTGSILGTPAYMSPEQAMGEQGDARSDIFSFGVIAFELLTGELPFPNRTLTESLLSRTQGRARAIESVNPDVPSRLRVIVMRCLQRDPAMRYLSVEEIVADLESARPLTTTSMDVRSNVLVPGSMVGARYRIEAEAGEGGIGKVYRATDLDLHRTVALKVVRPELAQDGHTLDQLMHEIAAASQISHKNVLRIHDLGEASGLRFVSMAWAEGEDLRGLLTRTGVLSEERIVQLGVEICEGLEAAHEQGISHRDLKPSNILLTSTGHACIADFGLAVGHDAAVADPSGFEEQIPAGLSASLAGTLRYMSPEQADGSAAVDHRSDIYSLGLILYEMATGQLPPDPATSSRTRSERSIETAPPNPKSLNPALSDSLSGVIGRCLERTPEQRFPNVSEVKRALAGRPEQALIPTVGLQKRRAGALRSFWFYTLAAILLVAAAAGVVWHRKTQLGEPPKNGKYIAVLPFRALSEDQTLKYRAEGISDAISARLATLESVHPVSEAALQRVSLSQPEEKIGKEVGANLLLRGTVQSVVDRIKVDASIYNVEKHQTLWSKSYEGATADLFRLEDEICNDAVQALKVNPTLQEMERAAPAPTRNLGAYDLYLKGRDLLKNHRDAASAKSALDLFEQATKQDDRFALAWTGVADASGLLYRLQKNSIDASRAVSAAEEAKDRNANLPEVHFALGTAYTDVGRNNEAISEIQRALQLSPNSDNGYIRLGRAYLAAGREKEGLDALKRAVQLNQYYWYNHYQLGKAYNNLGRYDEARKEFQDQITQDPSNPDGYNNLGVVYTNQEQLKKAIPQFEKAIQIRATAPEYSNLASAYFQLGQYAEAIPMYQKALELNPDQVEVARNAAEAYARTGQPEQASKAYDRAISLLYGQLGVNPENAEAIGTLALCYAGKKDLARARELITRARAIDPSNSTLMYDEAVVNAVDGRIPEALSALKNALTNGHSLQECLRDPDLKAVRESPGFAALKKQFRR